MSMTFRSSKIVYYGPYPCGNCGIDICAMGHDFGGTAFTYPSGPIYPNTEWHPHVCDPEHVKAKEGRAARDYVLGVEPDATVRKKEQSNYHTTFYIVVRSLAGEVEPLLSNRSTFYRSEWDAWRDAEKRLRGNDFKPGEYVLKG